MAEIVFCFYALYVKYNHGIALLSALCKEKGIKTQMYILDDVYSFSLHLQSSDAGYIGFSCVTVHDYNLCLPFMHEAKRLGKIVLLGGVYIRRGAPIDAPVDYICRGEGESLPDFILHGDDRLFREKMMCNDIEALPLPDYALFQDIPFERGIDFLIGKKILPYYSSRGCPYQCSFCEVKGQTGIVRLRCKVQDDLSLLAEKYAPDVFFIGDELLPYYSGQWRDSWGNFVYPFVAYIRADIPERLLLWLCEHGMKGCAFGIEAGDEKYRNEILKKNLTDKDIYKTVKLLKEMNMPYAAFYMADTPHETFENKSKTYSMAERIGGYKYIWKYEEVE